MTTTRTFPSRYSPEKEVTVAQYIVELVCENYAKKFGKGELPIHFWRQNEWKKRFRMQSIRVSQLLKKYHQDAVIEIVKSKRIWNLFPKWIAEEIEKINDRCVKAAEQKRQREVEEIDRSAKNSRGQERRKNKLWEMLDE
jgi:hypothetical protein